MLDLTVVIITKNEEDNIKKCIESFMGIAKRFVIVDSYSTDGTKEICKELASKIDIDFFENSFIDHATQINWALDNTNIDTTWIMRIDADEELTTELVGEMKYKIPNLDKSINGVILKRRVYFMGKWIKHGAKYPELLLRIFRNGYARCEEKIMDEHMVLTNGKLVIFMCDMIDNNNKSLEWWINKHNWYSNKEVLDYQTTVMSDGTGNKESGNELSGSQAKKKRVIKNKGYYKLPLFFRSHIYFIYRYYIRLGFLDGKEGRIYHFLQAYWYRFLVDAKIYECRKFNMEIKSQGDLK